MLAGGLLALCGAAVQLDAKVGAQLEADAAQQAGYWPVAAPNSRRNANEVMGIHIDRDCMMEAISGPKPCQEGGTNCGACVLVLGYCEPSPPPVIVWITPKVSKNA